MRQGSFEELEASLLGMQAIYSAAVASDDLAGVKACRRAVIQAKNRARMIARNPKVDPVKRKQKEEMAEWILVWLENPGIFESWVALRKRLMVCRTEPD